MDTLLDKNLMRQLPSLAALLALLIFQVPVEAQSFQAKRLGGGAQAADRQRQRMSFEFSLDARQHHIHALEGTAGVVVREDTSGAPSEGLVSSPRAGLPDLGMRMVRVLLPYEAREDGLYLEVLDEQTESLGFFTVAPVGVAVASTLQADGTLSTLLAVPAGVELDEAGRDHAAYGSEQAIPTRGAVLTGVGSHRAYRYARVAFLPFRWNPATHELTKVLSVKLKLTCQSRGNILDETRDLELGDPGLDSSHGSERYHLIPGVYESYDYPRRSTTGDYLIITTDLIKDTSDRLKPFMDMKTAQGHSIVLKTIEEILALGPSISRPESLRSFLRSEYQQLGVEHLLLIGDPDPDEQGLAGDSVGDLPMLMTWPRGAHPFDPDDRDWFEDHPNIVSPTDLYYTELSQVDWDRDGDGFPGEFVDDRFATFFPGHLPVEYGFFVDQYPIDFDEELTSARIPFGDIERVDAHLNAQIQYQGGVSNEAERQARRRVTLAMAEFHWSTSIHLLGRLIGNEAMGYAGNPFTLTDIYQVPAYDVFMEEDALADHWSQQFGEGLVIFAGHGSARRTVVNVDTTWALTHYMPFIQDSDVPNLTSTFARSIVISIACQNSKPSVQDNLTHELLVHTSVGMFAHTGSGFYLRLRSNPFGELAYAADLGYLISLELMAGQSIGESLRSTRGTRVFSDSASAQNLLVMTAYGDPTSSYLYQ
jgi:hypothetical protein